jgi:archaemetzincin
VLRFGLLLPVFAACGQKETRGPGGSPDAGPSQDPPFAKPSGEALEKFLRGRDALKPLHKKKGRPEPGDWLDRFDEKGQTLEAYLDSDPIRPGGRRNKLYIVLLGDFGEAKKKIVEKTAAFMGIYFNLPVAFAEPIPLDVIPGTARRGHPSWGMPQVHAGYILDSVLKHRVPKDAVALIAFTTSDLWPGRGWNFVFGMASIRERVGVWSIYRFGDPAGGEGERVLCLARTLGTGTHETGHMLGMLHCIAYECNMNGSNSLPESDETPLALCPECAAKIWWACGGDPVERYRKLEVFCRENGLTAEAEVYKASREAIARVFEGK